MKLSEAIRKGSEQRPQFFGEYFGLNEDSILASCAIGAAIEGFTGSRNEGDGYVQLLLQFPQLKHQVIDPVTNQIDSLANTITELNDEAKWTREAIADWVEKIENTFV